MTFIKGQIPWNKGKSHSQETKKKLSEMKKKLFSKKSNHPMYGKKHSDETKGKMRQEKLKNPTKYWLGKKMKAVTGEKNNKWVGDKIKYGGIHAWLNRHKKKLERCEFCNRRNKLDYANISGEYLRDAEDYLCLCRSCHMTYDLGRRWYG